MVVKKTVQLDDPKESLEIETQQANKPQTTQESVSSDSLSVRDIFGLLFADVLAVHQQAIYKIVMVDSKPFESLSPLINERCLRLAQHIKAVIAETKVKPSDQLFWVQTFSAFYRVRVAEIEQALLYQQPLNHLVAWAVEATEKQIQALAKAF